MLDAAIKTGRAALPEQVDLYRFFASLLGPPSAERFEQQKQPALADFLVALWAEFRCEGEFPGVDAFRDYEQYESIYIALFDVGVPEPPVPLLESHYVKTQPAQTIALENTLFYEVLGLKVDSSRFAPDHLVAQLEFLAAVRYACANAPDAKNQQSLARLERDFLARHLLNWLPAARDKLEREQPPTFPLYLRLLAAFLTRRLEEAQSQVEQEQEE